MAANVANIPFDSNSKNVNLSRTTADARKIGADLKLTHARENMRNRAKCKLCEEIIESKHQHDYAECSCKQIAVDGGDSYFKAHAVDWHNFIRIDDEGKEVPVKVQEVMQDVPYTPDPPTQEDRMKLLNDIVSRLGALPEGAMLQPVTHMHLYSVLLVISELLKHQCDQRTPPASPS